MLRMTFWTCVGLFGCLYVFGGDLSPEEQARVDAHRADRVSVVAMVREAFSDDDKRRRGSYVPTLAELEEQGLRPAETLRASGATSTTPTVITASFEVPQVSHTVTRASDPAQLAALIATPIEAPQTAAVTPKTDTEAVHEADDMILRVVSGNRVNVRSGPSTGYGVVGQVIKADIVRVVSNPYNEWVKILVEGDGVEGYMSARFLDELPE